VINDQSCSHDDLTSLLTFRKPPPTSIKGSFLSVGRFYETIVSEDVSIEHFGLIRNSCQIFSTQSKSDFIKISTGRCDGCHYAGLTEGIRIVNNYTLFSDKAHYG
jgi:hypothetical protein